MHSPLTYETHLHIEHQRFRDRERQLGHARARRAASRPNPLMGRLVARFAGIRPDAAKHAVLTYDLHELQGAVCRLADGAMGRIAVRRAEGVWVAVCEPA